MPAALPELPRYPGYTDGRGARFTAFSLTEAQAMALCALARELGIRPTDSSSYLTESKSH